MSQGWRPPTLAARPSNNTSTDSSSKQSGDSSGSPGFDPRGGSRAKRSLIESACSACRRRKSRCSGQRPICSRCQALHTECIYDAEEGESRWSALRRRNQILEAERRDWFHERDEKNGLIKWLITRPEPEAQELVTRAREIPEVEGEEIFTLIRNYRDRTLSATTANSAYHRPVHPIPPSSGIERLPPIQTLINGNLEDSTIGSANRGLQFPFSPDASRDSSGS